MDLAIIDDIGNLTILSTGVLKNTSSHQLSCFEDVDIIYQDDICERSNISKIPKTPGISTGDSLTKAIAFKWLNVDKPIISNSPAVRVLTSSESMVSSGAAADGAAASSDSSGYAYSYAVHQYKSYGTLHPIQGKSGFFAVRRNGEVDFYYQWNNTGFDFKKITILLEDVDNLKLLWLEHASIGFNRDGSVIIAVYSPLAKSLRVYKVIVDWGDLNNNNSNNNNNNSTNSNTKIQPSLKVEKLISEPLSAVGSNGFPQELTGIDVISPNFSLDTELELLFTFEGPGVSGGKTILQKYQISNEYKNLRFKNDSNGYPNSNGMTTTTNVDGYFTLVQTGEAILNEQVLDISFKNFDFIIVLTLKNGEIQLRNRKNLFEMGSGNQDIIPSAISTLLDADFKFELPKFTPEFISISPNLCGYVALNSKDRGTLEYQATTRPKHEMKKGEILTLSAAFGYKYSSACFTNMSSDDLIIAIQAEVLKIEDINVRNQLILAILQESHRALNFSLDHSKDQIDRLLVNPPIQKLLSLQYSLGKLQPINEVSSIALAILNLRLVAFSIMLSLRTLFHHQQRITKKGSESLMDAIYRSENILSTLGTINWFIEFLIFTIQELMAYFADEASQEDPSNRVEHQTIVFAILLSKIPRSLVIYSIAGIKRIDGFLIKIQELNSANNPGSLNSEILNKSVERYKHLLTLIDLERYEKFLIEIESIFQRNLEKSASLSIEQTLIFQNKIPPSYLSSINVVLTKFQEQFQANSDLLELYLHDTEWLHFQMKRNPKISRILLKPTDKVPILFNMNDTLIDDVTKVVITNKERLKKCLRCEYITSNDTEGFFSNSIKGTAPNANLNLNHWPVAFHRTCLCGSCWVYIDSSEVTDSVI